MLNGNALGLAIASAINTLSEAEKRDPNLVWQKVAVEIVNHIKNNLELQVGSLTSTGTGNMGAPVTSQNTTKGVFL